VCYLPRDKNTVTEADAQAGDFALGRAWPEYQMETNFVSNVLNTALDLDAKLSSHPIEADIPDEGKIAQVRSSCLP
jgi:hypothetical protein